MLVNRESPAKYPELRFQEKAQKKKSSATPPVYEISIVITSSF